MSKTTYIKNAKIVTPNGLVSGSLLIENGIIKNIGEVEVPENAHIIDAFNQYLLPGGIDAHVHFDLQTKNGRTADDFKSGSLAALAGGTTTIIDFISPEKNQDLQDAFNLRVKDIQDIYTNYSFHQSITHWDKNTAKQMEEAVKYQSITSFKTYLTYSSTIGIDLGILEKVMNKSAELNTIVLVHAEDGDLNNRLSEDFKLSPRSPGYIHKKTHPVKSEVQAIKNVIELVKKTACKTYIVHVSTEEGIEAIIEAKNAGLPIYAETCPQYFCLHDQVYAKKGRNSIENIMSPPLRDRPQQQAILQYLALEKFDCISTDHCSFMWKDKYHPSKSYFDIPQGIGGVQYRILLSHRHLISTGMANWSDFAKLIAGNPAEIFGLKNKGKIEVGYDADLVLLEETLDRTKIDNLKNYSKSDINVFAKQGILSKINYVIKGGEIVVEKGELKENITQGKFIQRKTS